MLIAQPLELKLRKNLSSLHISRRMSQFRSPPRATQQKPHMPQHISTAMKLRAAMARLRAVIISSSVASFAVRKIVVSTRACSSAQSRIISNSFETSMFCSIASCISTRLAIMIGPVTIQKIWMQHSHAAIEPPLVGMAPQLPQKHIMHQAMTVASPVLPTCSSCPDELSFS